MKNPHRFYVYVLFRPTGEPCYVGKGQGKRWQYHSTAGARHYNKRLGRIIVNAGGDVPAVIIRSGLSDIDALATEVALIRAIGRLDIKTGPLTNLSDGGDGQSGWIPTEETRARIKAANTGKRLSDFARKKMSATRSGRPKSATHRAALAAHLARVRNPPAMAKRIWTETMREALRQRVRDQHARMTPEAKRLRSEKISRATRDAMTPVIRAKISAARKRETNVNGNT